MKSLRLRWTLLGSALLMLAFSSVASAQATRTWVSGVGDDANPCSRTAPCKTFAGAISKTAATGEIDCLDPGGFGAVTITKGITIDCDSGAGGVLVSGTNGIVIAATASTDVITLRNLNIVGTGTGLSGVLVNSAKAVHLVNMTIKDFSTAGVNINTSAQIDLTLKNVVISECPTGIQTNTSAGVVAGDFDHIQVYSSTGSGVDARNGSRLQIHESTFDRAGNCINQSTLTGNGSIVLVSHSAFSFCGNGLQSIAGGNIGSSTNTFMQNSTVFNPNGGTISSSGDNILFLNVAPGVINGSAVTKM